jgi:hypothetical protein
MTIFTYLIRIIISLAFVYSTTLNIISIYIHTSDQWNEENKTEVYLGNIVLAIIWLGSAYLLWVIK